MVRGLARGWRRRGRLTHYPADTGGGVQGTFETGWEWERTPPPPAPEDQLLQALLFQSIVDALKGDEQAGRWVETDGVLVANYLGMDAAADTLRQWRTRLQLPPAYWERPRGEERQRAREDRLAHLAGMRRRRARG